MIIKWQEGESFRLKDYVSDCKLRRDGAQVEVTLTTEDGTETFHSPGPVYVMNDDGVTIDRCIIR